MFKLSFAFGVRGGSLQAVATAAAVVAFCGTASAAVVVSPTAIAATASGPAAPSYTYAPSPGDLFDLDHHYTFAWEIPSVAVTGNLTGATLTFKQLYNWDGNANDLFIHLLDSAKTLTAATNPTKWEGSSLPGTPIAGGYGSVSGSNSVVTWYTDETANPGTNLGPGGIYDDFAATRYHSDPQWLVAVDGSKNDINDTLIDAQSFAALGGLPSNNPGPNGENPVALPTSGALVGGTWYYKANGTSGGNQLYDYTYVFTDNQLTSLGAYIANNGGDIALGFDPDCHFFNTGIALNLYETVGSQASPVPEPASLFLVGLGLAFGAARYRRKGAAK